MRLAAHDAKLRAGFDSDGPGRSQQCVVPGVKTVEIAEKNDAALQAQGNAGGNAYDVKSRTLWRAPWPVRETDIDHGSIITPAGPILQLSD